MTLLTTSHDGLMDSLAKRLRGSLILPADPRYESARRVWNGLIDRRPRAIACVADEGDVVTAIQFAREHELLMGGAEAATARADSVPATTVCSSTSPHSTASMSILRRASRTRRVARSGDSSTRLRIRIASPPRAA